MLHFLRTRLQQGFRTVPFPEGLDEFPERFRGGAALDSDRCPNGCREAAEGCPTGFLRLRDDGTAEIDAGACLFSPEEVAACPHGAVWYSRAYPKSSETRDGLVSRTGAVALAKALKEESRRLFGRSLRLRSVSAGSCNGCESELVALGNVVFDLARFGIQFVASPRHADGIVVTGAVSVNMRSALLDTIQATPEPRLVIAVGACAISGGPFQGSPEVCDGIPREIPVDLWIPGCPPHPLAVLDGLLRLLGRIEDGSRRVAAVSERG